MEYTSQSADETKNLAKSLAKKLTGVIALVGDLGAGKTTFVQGFTKGLGIKDKIISPSFVLIRIHKIPKSSNRLFHIDLYRLDNPKEFKDLGLEEIIQDPKNIVLIEWAEKIEKLLPKSTTWIYFENIDEHSRKIKLIPKY